MISHNVKTKSKNYNYKVIKLVFMINHLYIYKIFINLCFFSHVTIGFTEDGKYMLTYISNIKFNLSDTSICSYQYVLYWWKFDLWNKLEKVQCDIYIVKGVLTPVRGLNSDNYPG